MKNAVPQIIELLQLNSDWSSWEPESAVAITDSIRNLSRHCMWCLRWPTMELMFLPAIFHDALSLVPQIVNLLKDNNSDVRSNCVGALGQLAKHRL